LKKGEGKEMSSVPDLNPAVIFLIRGSRILDVACGLGKWGKLIRSSWSFTCSGKLQVKCEIMVGSYAYLPYLKSF
jgi:hypothetical protein